MSALGSGATLDTASFGSIQVVSGDPIFSVGLCAGCDGWTIVFWLLTSDVNLLDGGFDALALLLLWEVGGDPDVVEEVADANGAGEEEEVEEDTSRC